jgi:hypothetical protein
LKILLIIICYPPLLEIKPHTEDKCAWTWIHVVVDTVEDFRIDTLVACDCCNILNCEESAKVHRELALLTELEHLAKGNLIKLEERSVMNIVVREVLCTSAETSLPCAIYAVVDE